MLSYEICGKVVPNWKILVTVETITNSHLWSFQKSKAVSLHIRQVRSENVGFLVQNRVIEVFETTEDQKLETVLI